MTGCEERPRLTVAMIVQNDADALEQTLASIKSIADEIVVLDTGSSDDTAEVARRHGAIVPRRPWDDDFSAARNACFELACGDWVLWLDAGETLSPADAASLREFLDTRAEPHKAYMLLVNVPCAPGEIAGEQKGGVRLLPNYPALRFHGRVRECVMQSLADARFSLEVLPQRILRGTREHDPQLKAQRARRNLMLADLEIAERGPLSHLLNCQGEALATLGDCGRAAELHRTALENADPGSTDMLEAYYGLLTALEGEADGRQAQLAVCLDAIESFPLDTQLLCAMGGYLQSQGKHELAARAYHTAWQYGKVNPEVWHLDDLPCIAANCYAVLLQLMGRDDEALQVMQQTLEQVPEAVRLRRHLIELHVKHGRRDEALAEVARLPAELPHREALRSAVRGACLAAEQNWIAARAYLDVAWQAGCRDVICMRWLAVSLLALGENAAAHSILDAWREIDPDAVEPRQYLEAIESAPRPSPPSPSGLGEQRLLRVDGADTPKMPSPGAVKPIARDASAPRREPSPRPESK